MCGKMMVTNGGNIDNCTEAIDVKLTLEILDSIAPAEVIYAETAVDGAMGNQGELIIYLIKENQLICYRTDMFSDKEVHLKASVFLSNHESNYFNLHYGGFGNYVLISKEAELLPKDLYFSYVQNGLEYKIYSSVRCVFYSIAGHCFGPK